MSEIRRVLINRKRIKQQSEQAKSNKARQNSIHRVPQVALWVANLLVLSLDYRVVEAIYALTGNFMLALFALFTSGLMFVLWFDVLYQYLLANEWQGRIALAFSAASLVSAGVFAFLDYGISAGFGVDKIMPVEVNMLFAGMVVMTVLNGIGLFAWYILDDQVKRKSTVERERADNDFEAEKLEDAGSMLAKAGEVLEIQSRLEARFGKEAVSEMMSVLSGLENALGVDLDGDGKVGSVGRVFAQKEAKPLEIVPKSDPTEGR